MSNPDLASQHVSDLKQLVEEYPYFHTGHQLYLQSLKKTSEEDFARQLPKSALCVCDRALLYQYIMYPAVFQSQISVSKTQAAPTISVEPTIPIEPVIEPVILTPPTVQPTEIMPVADSAIKGISEEQLLDPSVEKTLSNEELMAIIERQLANMDLPSADQPVAKESPIVAADQPTEQPPLAMENKDVEGITSIANDLIDAFLQSNPKIVPTDSDYHVDLSEDLQGDSNTATETLADIFASQGHIDKAIEIYEQLILKYPEKHIYFAAQIDRLKQGKN